jgi:adenosylhomocysteine nucleosidase
MIAIFFALSQETASLKPQVNILKKIRCAGAVFYQSEYHGFPVTLVQTGIGKNAEEIIRYLSKCFRIQLMISSGFAGSVRPEVKVGNLIIGKHALSASLERFDGDIRIDTTFPCDTTFVNLANMLGRTGRFTSHCGDVLTVDKIINQSSVKKHIGNNTSAVAVDMESFSIAAQASAQGIPFVVIRAISDGMDEDMEVYDDMVTESGDVNVSAAALHVLMKPHHILQLNRLRRQAKLAANTLSAFLPNFIAQVYNSLLT